MSKLTIRDAKGNPQEVELDASVYKEAQDNALTVPQIINTKFETDPVKYGTAFEQMMAGTGMFLRADASYGIRPPTMADILDGKTTKLNAGVIVREASPSSRILFPAVVLEAIENKLKIDQSGYVASFDSLIAVDDSINGARFEQPILNFAGAEKARHMGVGQNVLPPNMLTITVGEISRRIPTFSLGLEITKEAMQATSLDFVSLALARQAEVERASRVDAYWNAMLNGDVDVGQAALSSVTATSFDASIANAAGVLSHKAWIKWLRKDWKKRRIDWVITTLDGAFAIENRTGKPTVQTDDPKSSRIDALVNVSNPQWQSVKLLLVDDGVIPANTIIGIDSRYAIRRVRNSQAEYAAVEEFVLKKSEAMRYDFGEIAYRMFDEAWSVLSLT